MWTDEGVAVASVSSNDDDGNGGGDTNCGGDVDNKNSTISHCKSSITLAYILPSIYPKVSYQQCDDVIRINSYEIFLLKAT